MWNTMNVEADRSAYLVRGDWYVLLPLFSDNAEMIALWSVKRSNWFPTKYLAKYSRAQTKANVSNYFYDNFALAGWENIFFHLLFKRLSKDLWLASHFTLERLEAS